MKTSINNLFRLSALIAGLGLIPAGRLTAQTFTTLHSFTADPDPLYTNSDGAFPWAGLILSGNTLYGSAADGGSLGAGTVFTVNIDGTGFTILHGFTATAGPYPSTNSDGARPFARLILSGNTLYGTALEGGSLGNGTVFAVCMDGTGFTNLHSFTPIYSPGTNSDGTWPYAGLILSGKALYGTAYGGGSSSYGTVFRVNTDGTGFTNLHSFSAVPLYPSPSTNSDGANPYAGLVLSGNTCMGRRNTAGVRAMARCLPSTPVAPVLRTCIVLPHSKMAPTAMELIRLPN